MDLYANTAQENIEEISKKVKTLIESLTSDKKEKDDLHRKWNEAKHESREIKKWEKKRDRLQKYPDNPVLEEEDSPSKAASATSAPTDSQQSRQQNTGSESSTRAPNDPHLDASLYPCGACFFHSSFSLVAFTRLYNPLRRSVGRSVWTLDFKNFGHYYSGPIARDNSVVYPVLFFHHSHYVCLLFLSLSTVTAKTTLTTTENDTKQNIRKILHYIYNIYELQAITPKITLSLTPFHSPHFVFPSFKQYPYTQKSILL